MLSFYVITWNLVFFIVIIILHRLAFFSVHVQQINGFFSICFETNCKLESDCLQQSQ